MISTTRHSIKFGSTRHLRMHGRRSDVNRPPVSMLYGACLFGGLVVGLVFGDRVLPNLGAALGDPLANIFLGVFGGLCAGIACETVGEVVAALLRLSRSKS